MNDVQLVVGNDYPLSNAITFFEAYMFITTPKFIAEHSQPVTGELVIVDGKRNEVTESLEFLSVRKSNLSLFNSLAKAQIPSMPSSKGLS